MELTEFSSVLPWIAQVHALTSFGHPWWIPPEYQGTLTTSPAPSSSNISLARSHQVTLLLLLSQFPFFWCISLLIFFYFSLLNSITLNYAFPNRFSVLPANYSAIRIFLPRNLFLKIQLISLPSYLPLSLQHSLPSFSYFPDTFHNLIF